MDVLVWVLLVALAVGVLYAIISGRMSGKGAGIASITAYHDMQPKDKQEAIEDVIDQHAGKSTTKQQNSRGTDG